MNTKALANQLIAECGTRDPFRLAEILGYLVIYTPLQGIRGFYQTVHRCHIIYLDSGLDAQEARFVCAHELGHALLHRNLNRIFMDTHTHMVSNRYETEADHFAVDLLLDDYELQHYLTLSLPSAASCLGLSKPLAAYRLSSVQPTFFPL